MASGSFNLTRSSGSSYLTFRVDWSSSSNGTAANSSNVRVKVYVSKSSSSTEATHGTVNTSVTVGGSTQTNNGLSVKVAPDAQVLLFDKTYKNIAHNADGSKSVTISATVGGNVMGASGSKSVTLDKIARFATITAAQDFNDTANPTITYSNPTGNSVTTLQACIASTDAKIIYVPYRDITKTGTSYTFPLTDAERKTLRKAVTSKDGKLAIKFYVKTVISDTTYYASLQKTLSLTDFLPTLSPVIKDIGSASTVLTGDENKIIKAYNYITITTGATAKKEATIVSQKVTCGNKSITSASGSMVNVDSGTFYIEATDSRGNTVKQTVTKTLIDYIKLTCGVNATILLDSETTSKIEFTISGKYFNGSFGATANTLTVQYRYKTNSGNYGSWNNLTASISGNSYTAAGSISGLPYENTYTLEVRAIDKINTGGVSGGEKVLNTTPVFDWGREDFNFNVPVTITSGGTVYNLLDLAKVANIVSKEYQLTTTFTKGANYSTASANAALIGNNLRIYYNVTRSSSFTTTLDAADIPNEIMVTLTINHGGKIKTAYNTSFVNGNVGNAAIFQTEVTDNGDTTTTIDLKLCAITSKAGTSFSGFFSMPVVLNLEAY